MIDLIQLAERGVLPDAAVRMGIRRLLRARLAQETKPTRAAQLDALYDFIAMLRAAPVAVATDTANEQHYEVPADLFRTFMGPYLKYSAGYWPNGVDTLAAAEKAMLEYTCEHAGLADGMDILELGCGWGSLSLWMAERYPNARITAVSNSSTQKDYINARGARNLTVQRADMNHFDSDRQFDRVVSVEMFEHMRNWPELLRRIHGWLKDDGRCFIHIFTHRELAYLFHASGRSNWMAEHFFKEGMMPSEHLLFMLHDHLVVERHWRINGVHYGRTLRAWLRQFDAARDKAIEVLARDHGPEGAQRQFMRWRIFFMACEELFNFKGGNEWYVSHYLLNKR